MKRKFANHLFSGSILFLLLAQTGCYSQTTYPYGTGYGENGQYYGGYPVQGYGSNYPSGYGQGYTGYSGRQGYQGNEDDDDDYREKRYDRHRSWQSNPYSGYYGR